MRTSLGWLLGIAAIIAAARLGSGADEPAVVRARRFELVDGTGKVRIAMEMASPKSGDPVVPSIRVFNDDHATIVRLAQNADGGGVIAANGSNGSSSAMLQVGKAGAGIGILDESDKPQALISWGPTSDARISFFDDLEKVRARFPLR